MFDDWAANLLDGEGPFLLSLVVRFILAILLSGLIGYEREHSGRPAGFRTHILVQRSFNTFTIN